MKICIVSTIFPPDIGGPSKHIYELSKRLASQGHEVHIATYTSQESRHELLDGFIVHRISIKNIPKALLPVRVYKMRNMIIDIVKKYNIDVIYALNIDLAGLPATQAAKKMKKPVVLRYGGDYIWEVMFKFNKTSRPLHSFYENEDSKLFKTLKSFQARMLRKFNHIIVPSDYYKNILATHFNINQENITVIKNPVNLIIKPGKKNKNEKFTLVTASRILRLKGIDYLLEAIRIITREHGNIHLKIIGDGPYKQQLIARAKDLNIDKYVTFLPGMKHEEVLKHIADADAYVLSSVSEVAPNVVLEAMSLKTPVVTTKVSDFDYKMNSEIALITPPKDSNLMAHAIITLMSNEELRNKLIKNSYAFVKKNISWKEAVQQTTTLLEKALTEKLGKAKQPLTGQPALSS